MNNRMVIVIIIQSNHYQWSNEAVSMTISPELIFFALFSRGPSTILSYSPTTPVSFLQPTPLIVAIQLHTHPFPLQLGPSSGPVHKGPNLFFLFPISVQ